MVSTMLDLFKDPFFIGIDRELDRFRHASEVAAKQSYPPYNLVRIDDDNYTLTLAVAGFAKQEIDISVENSTLTVTGEAISEDEDDIEYLHKGIAMRKFTRTFALGEYMEVVSAEINNGLLYISIRREVPEEKKPKQITIK
jgi:molecular chaperone IbpA